MHDFEKAVSSDKNRKAATKARADMLRELPACKRLHDNAYEALRNQGRQIKKGTIKDGVYISSGINCASITT